MRVSGLFASALIMVRLAFLAVGFDQLDIFNELFGLVFLFLEVGFTLVVDVLKALPAVEFKPLSELGNRHLLHQPVAAGLSRVEALHALDGNLLELSDLSDKLLFLGLLVSNLVGPSLGSLLQLASNLVSDGLVLSLLLHHIQTRLVLPRLDLFDDCLFLIIDLLAVTFPFNFSVLALDLHLDDKCLVLLDLSLLSDDGLLARQLHLDLLLLNVLEPLHLVFLDHLRLPSVELAGILQSPSHFLELLHLSSFVSVNQEFLSFERSHVELHRGFLFLEVRHRQGFGPFEVESSLDSGFIVVNGFLDFVDRGSLHRCEVELLLGVSLVLLPDGVDCLLATLLLLSFDVGKCQLIQSFGNGIGFHFPLERLGLLDKLRLGLRQVEWLELSWLFLGRVGSHDALDVGLVHRSAVGAALTLLLADSSHGKCAQHLACCTFLDVADVGLVLGQIALDACDDCLVDVSEVVVLHPGRPKVVAQVVRVEGELQENVHLGGLLAQHDSSEVADLQFVKSEETEVAEDMVQRGIVSVHCG